MEKHAKLSEEASAEKTNALGPLVTPSLGSTEGLQHAGSSAFPAACMN